MSANLRLRKTRRHKRWEERLADLVVAGGTLGLSACSGHVEDTARQPLRADAGTDGSQVVIPCGNADPDPCICGRPDASAISSAECAVKQACEAKGGTYTYVASQPCAFPEAAPPPGPPIPCGNANPDPCICGRPDASPTAATECAAKRACEAMGGTYKYFTTDSCELPDARATPDAAGRRGPARDASRD